MIHNAQHLKLLVRSMSKGDSVKAQIIIRNYVMGRFLERLSLSPYRDHLILKGGILVSAMIGLENRSTLDIDATIKNLQLSVENARKIVEEITAINLNDGMIFEIKEAAVIMDEADYAGIRVMLNTQFETMRTPLKIDFSTGDVITPKEVLYSYPLLFEDRTIPIFAYNLETMLAEKMETMLVRGTVNTRMRDFYDIHAFQTSQSYKIDLPILHDAFTNTCKQRNSAVLREESILILDEIAASPEMIDLWKRYQARFEYAAEISWDDVMKSIRTLYAGIASQ